MQTQENLQTHFYADGIRFIFYLTKYYI